MYLFFVWKNVYICMNACGCMFFMRVYCMCVYIYVYVMYIHIMCSSELLKNCALACGLRVLQMSYPYFVLFTLHKAQEEGIILTGT